MATLDEKLISFAPLDINTPIIGQGNRPSPQFIANQKQMQSVLMKEVDGNSASIKTYQQAIVDALGAGALKIDSATAEFDDILAGVQVSMEAVSAPAGITARYEINVRVAGSAIKHNAGLIIDLVDEGGGTYSGAVHINADKFTVGDGTGTGTVPFRIEAGITYIEEAVIKNLSLVTGKLADNAVTLSSNTTPSGLIMFTTSEVTYQTLVFTSDDGQNLILASLYVGWTTSLPSAFGNVKFRIRKNGTEISSRTVAVDDSWASIQTWFVTDQDPGTSANTYTLTAQALGAGGAIRHFGDQATLAIIGGKK
jgi:hypothetical protein